MRSRALRRLVNETQRDGQTRRFHRQSESYRPRSREWQGQTERLRPQGCESSLWAQQARWIRRWTDSTLSPPSEKEGIQTSRPNSVCCRQYWRTRGIRCLLYTSDAADDLLCVDLGG